MEIIVLGLAVLGLLYGLGVVGPVYTADGVVPPSVRFGRLSEQIVGQGHGKYYESVSRGNVYGGANATKRALTTALSTTGPFTLYNPLGSTKRLAIAKVGFGQGETGTLGTGSLFHAVYTLNGPVATQGGTIPSGTTVTPLNCDVGLANASAATLLEAVTLHTTAPVALYPWVNLSEVAAGTIGGNSNPCVEDVDGNIVLEGGGGWTPESIMAAGSSPTGYWGVVWEEIPVG